MDDKINQPGTSAHGPAEIDLREATIADANSLGAFFSSIPVMGAIETKVRRQVDFFSFYRRLQIPFKTFLLEKADDILGTASFLIENKKIDVFESKIAFACDLRIAKQRIAILNWTKHFTPLLQALSMKEDIEHVITSINMNDQQVMNSFIRTKTKQSTKPQYELLRKYNIVSIHGFYPLTFKINHSVKTRYCETTDKAQLINYLEQQLSQYDLVPEGLTNQLEKWISDSLLYSWRHFIIAVDQHDQIVGCTYPLSSSLLQDYFPQNYNQRANNFRQFLKFASFFGFARKLTKPFSRTHRDQTLNFRLLHFTFFNHPEVFKNLLKFAYQTSRANEFLVYAYETEDFQYRPPFGTVRTQMPHALYEIKTPRIDYEKYDSPLKRRLKKKIWLDGLWY